MENLTVTVYWIYENWTLKRSRMHVATCGNCNNGRGKQMKDSGRNGGWQGPFEDRELARKALEKTGFTDRATCPHCSP